MERNAGGFRQEAILREASEATSGGGSKKVLNEDLMVNILESDNLRRAFRQVKANKGAAGVDGMTVETFADHAREHWPVIKAKLEDGSYLPGAVGGVRIPKPNGGGTAVRDTDGTRPTDSTGGAARANAGVRPGIQRPQLRVPAWTECP